MPTRQRKAPPKSTLIGVVDKHTFWDRTRVPLHPSRWQRWSLFDYSSAMRARIAANSRAMLYWRYFER